MAILRKIAIVIMGMAFLLYPQAMHASFAAQTHHPLASHADGAQPHSDAAQPISPIPANGPADPAPVCSATGGMCVILLAPIPEAGAATGPLVQEATPPPAILDNSTAPAPHPPNARG